MAEQLEESVLDAIAEDVEGLSAEELREELRRHLEREETRKAKQKEYMNTPEAQAKRKEYYEKTKDKRAEYNRKRNARLKLLVAAAKKAGIYDEVVGEKTET